MTVLERPSLPLPRPREMLEGFSRHSLTNGFVAFLFAATGPLAILLAVATGGGLGEDDISSWLFASYGLAGLLSIAASLWYRQPLALAWTIPGAVLVGPALAHLSFNEVVGAYLVTGLLIMVLGLTGWVGRVMAAVPLPIVMAMVAGVFLPLGLDMIAAFEQSFWIALATVAAFLAVSATRLARLCPPILAALIAGGLVTAAVGEVRIDALVGISVVRPILYMPDFSWQAMAELVVPLAVTVIGIQNAQGFFILRQAGYAPPENALTVACGVGTLAFGLLGSVPTCVTGPSNAILNNSGAKPQRYLAGIVFGLLMLLFGLFGPVATGLGLALPAAFIAVLGGLALIGVLQGAFAAAFSGGFKLGALVTFLVTISGISLFNVGAAFWGLVFGYAVSRLLEREDFRKLRGGA